MSSKRVAATPSPSAAAAAEEPARKHRKKSVTAKSLGLTKEQFDSIKPSLLKKNLKPFVKTLIKQTNANWHDGWEEQGETAGDWFHALRKPLQAILDIGVGNGVAFEHCHDTLRAIGDSIRDIGACSSRIDVFEMLESHGLPLKLPWGGRVTIAPDGKVWETDAIMGYVWKMLLRKGANATGEVKLAEAVLFRAIKDASDNDVKLHSSEDVEKDDDELDGGNNRGGKKGDVKGEPSAAALDALLAQKDMWEQLEKRIKTFKQRGAVDRRFEDPLC